MKQKTILLLACFSLLAFSANAQLGDILNKAAKKATQKATQKMADKAADAAVKALESKIDSKQDNSSNDTQTPATDQPLTYHDIMAQLPQLPSADQYVKYKEAELNEQSLKLMVSPVTSFLTQSMSLSVQALSLIDTTGATDLAYKQAELSTGLSRQELEHLATLPDDQQEAYLHAHYKNGNAESALLKQATDASTYLEPLQPLIDQWDAFNNSIEDLYNNTQSQCKELYKRYASQLARTDGKDRNKILIKYYSEIAPLIRNTVIKALDIRLNEQLPLAEQIEEKMVKIRAQHSDIFSAFLNYPQLTATQYFSEPTHMLDIPEYPE